MQFRQYFPLFKTFFVVAFIFSVSLLQSFAVETKQYYINPIRGNDSNDGLSPQKPFKTIQHGLDVAQPGTIINLAKGIYRETLTTKVNGTVDDPITIRGSDQAKTPDGRYQTVLYGTTKIIVNINHSFYRLEGFAIDGQEALAGKAFPKKAEDVTAFKDANRAVIVDSKLIYVAYDNAAKELTGIKISNMYLRGAGGECVRLRNAAHHNEVSNSVIEYCGMFGKASEKSFTYHNGEAVYIGTSPKSTNQPMFANDTSNNNLVSNNIIHTYGSECFNVKENAHHNQFVNNECRYNLEPLEFSGSNVELRGDHNLIEGNTISDSAGANLKLKSDAPIYDKGGNIIRNNKFTNSAGNSIQNEASKTELCGNTVDNKLKGASLSEVTAPCKKN
jgi:hypothetical protein